MAIKNISAEQPHPSQINTAPISDVICLHCGEGMEGDIVSPSGQFCCSGCESAHTITQMPAHKKMLSQFAITDERGQHSLFVSVEGMHCGACLQTIERACMSAPGIISARVNMSTQRLILTWVGAPQISDVAVERVEEYGYILRPLDQTAIANDNKEHLGLLRKVAVAGFAAGNIMLLSVGLWTTTAETMGGATRDLFHWLSALIALPTVAYAGQPFFSSALRVIKQGHANMDVPISLAISLACVMSLFETINHGEHVYFDSAVMLVFFLLIGRYLEARAKGRARQSAAGLLSKLTGSARIIDGDSLQTIPVSELKEGMIAIVSAGDIMPADGIIISGTSEIDLSLITGESMPKLASIGDKIYAGTQNITAPLKIKVTAENHKSLLSDIVSMMEVAEQGNARYVRLADKAARLYTPTVHALSLLTFLGWLFVMGAPWQVALLHGVTVLIITCPCALGLAVPVVQVLASSMLMRRGVLLKSGDALEKLAQVDTVIFDKTGTLTRGNLTLLPGVWDDQDLQLAASLAAHSRHPISKAISAAYKGELIPLVVTEIPGKGLESIYGGKPVRLGNRQWLNIDHTQVNTGAEFWLSYSDTPPRHFCFSDEIRQDCSAVITDLRVSGLEIHMLTGDTNYVADSMASHLGITAYKGECAPAQKSAYIDALQSKGARVLFVGDGLNDAPALTSAHVSMSPSSAVDISQNAADIVFQGELLSPVTSSIKFAKVSTKLVKQNFGLAIAYNCIAVPLAVMGYVTPLVAAIAMSSSSLCVIINAFRLNLTKGNK